MGIIAFIVLGAIAGWIASMVTNSDRGLLGDVILGIVGALIGGWIVSLLGGHGVTGFNVPSLLVAVLGAVVVIWVSRAFRSSARNI